MKPQMEIFPFFLSLTTNNIYSNFHILFFFFLYVFVFTSNNNLQTTWIYSNGNTVMKVSIFLCRIVKKMNFTYVKENL